MAMTDPLDPTPTSGPPATAVAFGDDELDVVHAALAFYVGANEGVSGLGATLDAAERALAKVVAAATGPTDT